MSYYMHLSLQHRDHRKSVTPPILFCGGVLFKALLPVSEQTKGILSVAMETNYSPCCLPPGFFTTEQFICTLPFSPAQVKIKVQQVKIFKDTLHMEKV